jgi:DNA repair exonuclease SbcCD ATPase subunit
MRFVTADIRNYRLIRNVHVDFGAELTLIGGPNESGKSTIAEALHRVLFLKSRGNSEPIRRMKSVVWNEDPEVQLRFEMHGKEYELIKRFGPRGTTRLSCKDEPTLNNDEAELRLAELLETVVETKYSEVEAKWGHLWVWQGGSGANPKEFIGEAYGQLEKRLLEMASGIAVRSQRDEKFQAYFTEAKNRCFTVQNNAVRVNSPLDLAQKNLEACRKILINARNNMQRLQDSADRLPRLQAELEAFTRELGELGNQEVQLRSRSGRLTELNLRRVEKQADVKAMQSQMDRLLEMDQRIEDLKRESEELRRKIDPAEVRSKGLLDSIQTLENEQAGAESRKASIEDELKLLQQSIDILNLFITRMRIHSELKDIRERIRQASEIRVELDAVKKRLSELPAIDEKSVKRLRELIGRLGNAKVKLDSIATRIELVKAGVKVDVNENPLFEGTHLTITEQSHVNVGKDVVIKIVPGGGMSLDDAKGEFGSLSKQCEDAVTSLGVRSLEEGENLLAEIRELAKAKQSCEERIGMLRVNETMERETALLQELNTNISRAEAWSASPFLKEVENMSLEAMHESLAGKESQKTSLNQAVNDCALQLGKLKDELDGNSKTLVRLEQSMEKDRARMQDVTGTLSYLIESHGTDEERARSKAKSSSDLSTLLEGMKLIEGQIELLNPSQLDNDFVRLDRARSNTTGLRNSKLNEIADLKANLRAEGLGDPKVDLINAESDFRNAEVMLKAEDLKSKSLKLLFDLYEQGHTERTTAFLKPLTEKTAFYLEILFNIKVKVSVDYTEKGFEALSMGRNGHAGDRSFDFEVMSGGTREQLATAVRLAVAEVLAPSLGGRIPMVLDDAFVNTDPERIKGVIPMLDRASQNGVQVIILSCTPADYYSLGAKTLFLESAGA